MKIGVSNKISSFFGIKHALLTPKFRNRNPRAIKFQEALALDMAIQNDGFPNSSRHFTNLGYDLNSFLQNFLHLCIQVHEGSKSENEIFCLLQNWAKSKNKLTAGQWLEISMYLLSMGLFKSSYLCRNISYKNFNSTKNRVIYNVNFRQLLIAKHFDVGVLSSVKKANTNNPFWRSIFGHSYKQSEKEQPEFYNLIHGKKVAVIGPLSFKKNYKDEIADFDIIVELNALQSKREDVKAKYHGKPDLVYYNNFRLKDLNEIDFGDVVENVNYFVLKTDKYLNELSKKAPTRVISQTTTLNWNGSLSMLENTIADLLLFGPARIKIFGVNLYTSFNYDKSYGNAPPAELNRITLNFTVHDIFTQYAFMHNLYVLGLIKGDDEFEEVLKLGREGYVKCLEELYPKFLLNPKSN
jgi:hypothetical protein